MRPFPTARKLLAAAPLTLVAVLGCDAPPPRATSTPAAVTAPARAVPDAAATPLCDRDGRPLAGNLKRKDARSCAMGTLAATGRR